MDFVEAVIDYTNEWCERLVAASETKDMDTVSKMVESLQSPDDRHNPIRMIANRYFGFSICRNVVMALSRVKDLDSRTIAQSFVQYNCPINYVISEISQFSIDVMEHMIQLGSPVNSRFDSFTRTTALHRAIKGGDSHLRAIELLLDNGADLSYLAYTGLTPPNSCLTHRNALEVLRLLVSRGIHYDWSALLTAIVFQQPREFIQLLMQANTDVIVRDDRGFVNLYNAKRDLREGHIEYLLNLGLDPNTCSLMGHSILYFIFENASLSYVRYLVLVCGVNVNARFDMCGYTVLYISYYRRVGPAMSKQKYEKLAKKIRFCLLRGADVNYNKSDGSVVTDRLLQQEQNDEWLDLRVEQIVVREFMDRPVHRYIVNAVYSDKFWVSYIAICKLELVALMDTKLYGEVTLFNILTDSDAKMMGYVRNEELLEVFRKFCDRRLFLIYLPYLIERVEHFLYLCRIREAAEKVLCSSLLGVTNYAIVEEIAKYLSIKDLFELSKFYN